MKFTHLSLLAYSFPTPYSPGFFLFLCNFISFDFSLKIFSVSHTYFGIAPLKVLWNFDFQLMDPAAGVSSPFHNDLGKNSRMDHALEELTAAASVRGVNGTQNGSVKPVGSKRPRGNETTSHGTSCGRCGKIYPMKEVPAGGMYLCTKCAKEYLSESEGRHFPPNTLKCCPASVTEGSGGVVRCHACHGWYHCECLDIHDKSLKDYISLSTTKWYCMEPACCEKVLQEKLKRKK
uniref:PHD-type domain-containing protein n=1 Tax=Trypanosoma congolense (strain IL3000) TaxID=1068625 RepID=G0UK09_TRYCI|nr:conserved hypothetical protein [Trypanosoma congolense IL3000]